MTFERLDITQDGTHLALALTYGASALLGAAALIVGHLGPRPKQMLSTRLADEAPEPLCEGPAAVAGVVPGDPTEGPVVSVIVSFTGTLQRENKTSAWHYQEQSREVQARPFILRRTGTGEDIHVIADGSVQLGARLLLDGDTKDGREARRRRRAVLEPGQRAIVTGALGREIDSDDPQAYRDAKERFVMRAPPGEPLRIIAESAVDEEQAQIEHRRRLRVWLVVATLVYLAAAIPYALNRARAVTAMADVVRADACQATSRGHRSEIQCVDAELRAGPGARAIRFSGLRWTPDDRPLGKGDGVPISFVPGNPEIASLGNVLLPTTTEQVLFGMAALLLFPLLLAGRGVPVPWYEKKLLFEREAT